MHRPELPSEYCICKKEESVSVSHWNELKRQFICQRDGSRAALCEQPGHAALDEKGPWNRLCCGRQRRAGRAVSDPVPGRSPGSRCPLLLRSVVTRCAGALGAPPLPCRAAAPAQETPAQIDLLLMRLSPRNGPKTQAWSITSVGDLPIPFRGLKLLDCPIGPPAKVFPLLWPSLVSIRLRLAAALSAWSGISQTNTPCGVAPLVRWHPWGRQTPSDRSAGRDACSPVCWRPGYCEEKLFPRFCFTVL